MDVDFQHDSPTIKKAAMFVGYLLANHLISLGIIVLNPNGKTGENSTKMSRSADKIFAANGIIELKCFLVRSEGRGQMLG